jgi:hypothetical protein
VLYRWTRELHLYFGLFISPFLLLFAASVFFLNHGKVPADRFTSVETVANVHVPAGIELLKGRAAVDHAKEMLPELKVAGEIGFTRVVTKTRHFVFPVSKPGSEVIVDVDLDARSAVVSRRNTGLFESLSYLHKMPGPHNVALRGNWVWTQVWRWFADATVYFTMFVTITGLYLWYAIKAERRIGLAMLTAGAVTFCGLIYAVIR